MLEAGRVHAWHDAAWRRLWLLIFPLALPALAPFYTEGLTRTFDGGLHLLRLGLLDRLVRSGVFYPRWAPDALLGYGYPLFNFYAPAAYYLAEALVLFGLSPYAAFIAVMAIFVLAGGLGMYALALAIFGRRHHLAALVAAVAYVYSPYLLTNVFIRGAIAEAGAQALLPWILLAARGLYRGDRPQRSAFALALLLGLLAVTHTITLLTLPPILLLYMLLHWWTMGRDRAAARWSAAALLGAMGISAFFWLPLIGERRYLAATAYAISASVWLPASMWTWGNFLDTGPTYAHTFARPIRLGWLQALLALAGYLLARSKLPRQDIAEWRFWGGMALLLALLMGSWALPLWLNVEALSIIQFAWRLLTLLSLPLALFAGGIVLRPSAAPVRLSLAGLIIVLIIAGQQPRLDWMDVFAPETVDVSAPVLAQNEIEKGVLGGGEGNSSIQEFRPRWADRTLLLDPATVDPLPPIDTTLLRAGDFDLSLRTRAQAPTALRLAAFYFPGWRVRIDGGPDLTPYPSTNLGLLTFDVPAGEHTVDIAWAGTRLQWAASALSLAALFALDLLAWRTRRRPLAAALAGVAVVALIAWVNPSGQAAAPAPTALSPPADFAAAGLRLIGYRTAQLAARDLIVYPYWQVDARPQDDLRFEWSLSDASGAVVAQSGGLPFFNTTRAANWPPNSVVDDAVRLRLPADLPAGIYTLSARALSGANAVPLAVAALGSLTLRPTSSATSADGLPPATRVEARFGAAIRLLGFEVLRPRPAQPPAPGKPLAVRAGQRLRLALYWQALVPLDTNYHAFVHLVDNMGSPLVQEDQLPGPFFQPPRLWDAYTAWPDVYLLRIPATAAGGLYWPSVGVYDFATLERLPVTTPDEDNEASTRDDYRLPPIKIVGKPGPPPSVRLNYHFADVAALTGYDLTPDSATLQPGATLTVTLHLRALHATERNLTRFLQLYNPETGVIAQYDSPPQQGGNPTWAWLPDETVRDPVTLSIPLDAPAGHYTLYAGFYDPAQDNRRLEVRDARDAAGAPLSDQWAPVTAFDIAPAGP